MPELPEVENVVRGLKKTLRDRIFSEIDVRLPKSIKGSRDRFVSCLKGQKIVSAERRGKYILIRLRDGGVLLVHLRMTGKLLIEPSGEPLEKHTHIVFSFESCPFQLRFLDQRQFGRLVVEKPSGSGELKTLSALGPEPLKISSEDFIARTRARRREIKPLLLDQTFLAGVGNIYADETLHRAGIHPRRRGDTLKKDNLLRLYGALQEVLQEAIRAGGSSVRTYVNSRGVPGEFQKRLRVYGREGKACTVCGTPVVRERVGGRSSFFCPRCQPAPKRANPRRDRSGKWLHKKNRRSKMGRID